MLLIFLLSSSFIFLSQVVFLVLKLAKRGNKRWLWKCFSLLRTQ